MSTVRLRRVVERLYLAQKESRWILDATARGELGVGEACPALVDLAELMNRQADLVAERQSRWFPIVASIAIGTVAFVAYIAIVYLPWVQLLTRLSSY